MRMAKAWLFILLVAAVGCSSTPEMETKMEVSNKTILLVTAGNMNANSSSAEMNDLMKNEVASFAKSLKQNIEAMGMEVTFREFKAATKDDIALAIASMPKKPGTLIQAYWTTKPDRSMHITAEALKINYSSGRSVNFPLVNRKDYLSIGLAAKPSDTPEAHANAFSQFLKTVLP